jgi:hypothetical protein
MHTKYTLILFTHPFIDDNEGSHSTCKVSTSVGLVCRVRVGINSGMNTGIKYTRPIWYDLSVAPA